MNLDPELAALVPAIPPVDASDPQQVRDRAAYFAANAKPIPPEVAEQVSYEDGSIGRGDGEEALRIRIYRPRLSETDTAGMVFYFGGGWMSGKLENIHWRCVSIVQNVGCVVVAPEYRLAPENPFPAAPDDCYSAFIWTVENAGDLGIDLQRLGVGGASAGGGLAAAVTLMCRDRDSHRPAFQWLLYPGLDDRMETVSNKTFVDAPIWGSRESVSAWTHYLGEGRWGPEVADVSSYASPGREPDLSGLPPAYIITSDIDPTRDEGLDYGFRLLQAGVSVDLHNWSNTFHAFDVVGQNTEVGRRALDEGYFWLRRATATPA